jgi:hypothetical protein
MPSALADQTIQDSLTPNQPLRNVNELASSGRAAYEGQNLADFIGSRDTPESATEQFLDPQGRLRRRDKATQELTSDYTDYEKDAAAREGRAEESFGKVRGPDGRDNASGTMTMAEATKLSGGDRVAAAAMVQKSKSGYNPITNKLYTDEAASRQSAGRDAAIQVAGEGRAAEKAVTDAEKSQAQIDEIVARTKSKYGGEGQAVSSAEMKNTMQIMDDANVYYEPDTGKWMKKGGVWGKSGDKELDQNSEDYKKLSSTKGGELLLRDPELLNPDTEANDAMIDKVMGANPGATREEVIQTLKDAGKM